eukprot:scaffold127944_cov72-Phaeocystis_antarctica.AAC.7
MMNAGGDSAHDSPALNSSSVISPRSRPSELASSFSSTSNWAAPPALASSFCTVASAASFALSSARGSLPFSAVSSVRKTASSLSVAAARGGLRLARKAAREMGPSARSFSTLASSSSCKPEKASGPPAAATSSELLSRDRARRLRVEVAPLLLEAVDGAVARRNVGVEPGLELGARDLGRRPALTQLLERVQRPRTRPAEESQHLRIGPHSLPQRLARHGGAGTTLAVEALEELVEPGSRLLGQHLARTRLRNGQHCPHVRLDLLVGHLRGMRCEV